MKTLKEKAAEIIRPYNHVLGKVSARLDGIYDPLTDEEERLLKEWKELKEEEYHKAFEAYYNSNEYPTDPDFDRFMNGEI